MLLLELFLKHLNPVFKFNDFIVSQFHFLEKSFEQGAHHLKLKEYLNDILNHSLNYLGFIVLLVLGDKAVEDLFFLVVATDELSILIKEVETSDLIELLSIRND